MAPTLKQARDEGLLNDELIKKWAENKDVPVWFILESYRIGNSAAEWKKSFTFFALSIPFVFLAVLIYILSFQID